ncbi:MAG: glycosyltransferase family 4 protein [Candidatus Diapherotrites archaeon]
MKIVQVTHHVFPCQGGIESFVLALSKNLQKRGHNVKIVCLDKCAGGKKLKAFENVREIPVHRIPFTDFKLYKFAPGVLEKVKGAQVVHVHNIGFFSDFLAWTKKEHGAKLVLNTHGGIEHSQSLKWLKKAYSKVLLEKSLKKFDAIICDSVDDFSRFKKIQNAQLIENAVELETFLKLKGKKISGRMLFVGRLAPNKNLEQLMRVFARAAKNFPKAELRIAGEDWKGNEKKLKALAEKLDTNIVFLGKISEKELEKEYARAVFIVSASTHEGFGISIVEGMAAECIPLLSRIPSFERFVGKGRGECLDFEQSEKAVKELEKWLSKEEHGLEKKRAACRKFAKGFDWHKKIAEYESVYREVLK